ncbi:MAG TPA: SagB/ThcOx family dehydrogenase [Burkholderiaceae bacterium]|nr:SagB/ThcOx family dehydrogenase [Burkholderiaceae bacterium]
MLTSGLKEEKGRSLPLVANRARLCATADKTSNGAALGKSEAEMKHSKTRWSLVLLIVLATPLQLVSSQELKPISLPTPVMQGGKPLMEALALRSTSRAFASDALPLQTLSNLLWAADGINRPRSGLRTAPSAMNWQETQIYVVMASGTYMYEAATNTLEPVAGGDLRPLAGEQSFVKDAPVSLVYVADAGRMKNMPENSGMRQQVEELKESMKWADTAFISQNVYLFAASEGLATGVRALIDRPALAKALKLSDSQTITLAQSVGFPKK